MRIGDEIVVGTEVVDQVGVGGWRDGLTLPAAQREPRSVSRAA
jgi:hypothetical protein